MIVAHYAMDFNRKHNKCSEQWLFSFKKAKNEPCYLTVLTMPPNFIKRLANLLTIDTIHSYFSTWLQTTTNVRARISRHNTYKKRCSLHFCPQVNLTFKIMRLEYSRVFVTASSRSISVWKWGPSTVCETINMHVFFCVYFHLSRE